MVNANKLKARIVELGMLQSEVAKLMEIAQPTFSQKINNVRPMDLNEALALAKHLKISPSEYGDYFFYTPVAQCNFAGNHESKPEDYNP